jgi:hypothetical protein
MSGQAMPRGLTPIQANYPIPDDFVAMVKRWRGHAIDILFGYVWSGFDRLLEEEQFDLSQAEENLERGITQLVAQRIRDGMESKSPFYLEHHPFEDETRVAPPAAPPAPDLAFVLRANPRATLPLEAKVLATDGRVAEYVAEITDNFLKCRYAPFSSQGGMLAYLLSGLPSRALENIATKLGCEVFPHQAFPERHHACSRHQRTAEACKHAPRDFTCHHLIVLFDKQS